MIKRRLNERRREVEFERFKSSIGVKTKMKRI